VSVIEKPIGKGSIKENHVEEDCEREDELEACRSYRVKVLHRFVSVPSICNLWIIF
jgi:hypothetical protein